MTDFVFDFCAALGAAAAHHHCDAVLFPAMRVVFTALPRASSDDLRNDRSTASLLLQTVLAVGNFPLALEEDVFDALCAKWAPARLAAELH